MKEKPIYSPLVIVRKIVYISLLALGLYCACKAVAFYVYTENYSRFSSYIIYESAVETMSDEFVVCTIDDFPNNSPIKLTQVAYYPQQQQLVFGMITSRDQTHDSHIVIKKDANNVGVLSTGMSKDFLLKKVKSAWYELEYPLVFGEKYEIEYYLRDKCIWTGEIVFSKNASLW